MILMDILMDSAQSGAAHAHVASLDRLCGSEWNRTLIPFLLLFYYYYCMLKHA